MSHKHRPNVIQLDAIAWKILEALQRNARLTFAELGRKVGLSTPAAAERVRRLEEAGVITGYHAGHQHLPSSASPSASSCASPSPAATSRSAAPSPPSKNSHEISRCHRITGSESFVLEADVVSIRHMEALIDRLSALGATSTSTVLSSPVERRDYTAKQIEAYAKYL